MTKEKDITFGPSKLRAIKAKIPPEDFVDSCFDNEIAKDPTDILIILSTPRSGSTMLCDLLYKNDFCLAHEYFQPYEYLPILSDRWGCLQNGVLNKKLYVESLSRFRTFKNEWLGINLHGEHLSYYLLMDEFFSGIRKHYVHLIRKDTIAQAVSFEIARQTGQWSSKFKTHGECHYSYDGILQCLENIQRQNLLINAYLKAKNLVCQTIFYEDLLQDPDGVLRRMPCVPPGHELETQPELARQAGSRNTEWTKLFSEQYLARATRTGNGTGSDLPSRIGRLFKV